MSLGLADKEIANKYQQIVSGGSTEWMVLSYDRGSNDLKVQATGDSGLEEMFEEFMESRMQYGFIRVKDPNTQLPKYVQINWCGDGVPENRKGHFYSHSTAMSKYLQGTHIVINARSESDLETSAIMKKVNDASGSKYSVQNERARPSGPITPVGTAYTPIGQPDIQGLRAGGRSPITPRSGGPSSTAPSTVTTPSRPTPSTSFPPAAPVLAPKFGLKPSTPAWDNEPAKPAPSPVAPPPPVIVSPPQPAPKAAAPKLHVTTETKPEDDLIGPVGTNYVPVNLPKPKKLVNPFAARQQESAASTTASKPSPSPSGGKKLTWSERQAMAKKQAEEEEARSKAAAETSKSVTGANRPSYTSSSSVSNAGKAAVAGVAATGIGIGLAGAAIAASTTKSEPEAEQEAFIPPPPPPPPPMPSMPVQAAPKVVAPPEPEPEDEVDYPSQIVDSSDIPGREADANGKVAIVLYDYEATEEGEMDLIEGEYIEQIEEIDEGWWKGVSATDKNRAGVFPANYVESVDSSAVPHQTAQPEHEPEPVSHEEEPEFEPPPAPPAPPPPPMLVGTSAPAKIAVAEPVAPEPADDEGSVAIALYDYDAAEENEVAFKEGDRITNIEAASNEWWEGQAPDGHRGLFPANYVELQE